jgi:hypothetical protein
MLCLERKIHDPGSGCEVVSHRNNPSRYIGKKKAEFGQHRLAGH